MNPDTLAPGERCASTSNRNFEGRQGRGGRTHLVSPKMAAAAAVEGHFVDIREWSARGARPVQPRRDVEEVFGRGAGCPAEVIASGARDVIEGGVSVLDRADVDTDQIIPKQFLKRVERTGFGEFLFYDWAKQPGWEPPAQPRSSPPAATSAAAPRASTRRGRSRTTASRPSSRRASPTSSSPTARRSACCRSCWARTRCEAVAAAGEARIDLEAQTVTYGGRDGLVRHRPGDQAPAARRPRRHRRHTAVGRRHRRLRARSRARRPRHHRTVSPSGGTDLAHPRDWDADTYDRVSDPQVGDGRAGARRGSSCAATRPCSTPAAAAGASQSCCSSGFRAGDVVAVDAAPRWSSAPERSCPAERVDRRAQADLAELERGPSGRRRLLHRRVPLGARPRPALRRLHRALRPGGRLVAQCGGAGNVERFHAVVRGSGAEEPFARHLGRLGGPVELRLDRGHGAPARAGRLRRRSRSGLEPHPVVPEHAEEYLRTVCLGHHLERLPDGAARRRSCEQSCGALSAAARARLRPPQHQRAAAGVGRFSA